MRSTDILILALVASAGLATVAWLALRLAEAVQWLDDPSSPAHPNISAQDLQMAGDELRSRPEQAARS